MAKQKTPTVTETAVVRIVLPSGEGASLVQEKEGEYRANGFKCLAHKVTTQGEKVTHELRYRKDGTGANAKDEEVLDKLAAMRPASNNFPKFTRESPKKDQTD